MLQRAASNAYSWWWASHVRTKQSKWLEQSLQDMGDKVETVLKLITQDGDSFAKRAEMYYKHRPELISFVEESFRAYQSLAERYDHISKELQNANSTLASAFPDQFQYQMDDDDDFDDDGPPRKPKKFQFEKPPNPNIPKAPPKFPTKNIKAIIALKNSTKSPPTPAPKSTAHANKVPKSGLSKSEALTEIDKLQKQILTFQTEKEFAKSSYESGYAKYWSIDGNITGMQEKISKLQDEFGISQAIDDDEARTLMAEAAIKSCQDTLAQLQEKQERGAIEANAERQRIKEARTKIRSLKGELAHENQMDASETGDSFKVDENGSSFDGQEEILGESKDLEMIRDKIKEHFDVGETKSLTVTAMAEKIDELVNKVINLETAVSSQTALIHTLRSETDELQSHINKLEEDKANLIEGKNDLTDKMSEMEKKLKGLHELDRSFQQHDSSLKTHFSEARSNLDTISKKLHDVKPDEEFEKSSQSLESEKVIQIVDANTKLNTSIFTQNKDGEGTPQLEPAIESLIPSKTNDSQTQTQPSLEESKLVTLEIGQHEEQSNSKVEKKVNPQGTHQQQLVNLPTNEPVISQELQPEVTTKSTAPEQVHNQGTQQQPATQQSQKIESESVTKDEPVSLEDIFHSQSVSKPNDGFDSASVHREGQTRKEEDEPDWQQLFTNGLEGKEKVLLAEYTTTLRNYKEAKKKLGEIEKKSQSDIAGIEAQLDEMKNYNAMKDAEIHTLRQRLNALQKKLEEYKNAKEDKDVGPVRNEEPSPSLEDEDDIGFFAIEQEISPAEQKLRADIDEILEENLDFWMRFSGSFGQIQKFQNGVQDLFSELAKLEKDKEKKEGSSHGNANASLKSDIRPIYKHLREIETELTVWLEQSEKLKEELQRRFSQLCHIQGEIRHAVNAGAEDEDMKFTSYNAAKFQGEIANMQQENHKVADELQAGMDHITSLQVEVERTTTRLNEELGLSGIKSQNENDMGAGNRSKVPLSSFIFGVKPQKKKQSIFSCMHPAVMHRKYQHLKADKSE
ncbi:protein NETWORKED 2D [Silene latifolia]|uniref:protein NETWORKED 2D n=1 Tax=Silene latifolia TaxID=37657 RepID=UPI003D772668